MKTKLKEKLEWVSVLVGALVYSIDGLTSITAKEGDTIQVPRDLVDGLVKAGKVEKAEVPEETEPESTPETDEEGTVLTVAELKDLTEVDLTELETTEECIAWVKSQPNLNCMIHPSCKVETSKGRIFAAIEELTED
jgi:hypothetical protein